jgi:hypothetical protein
MSTDGSKTYLENLGLDAATHTSLVLVVSVFEPKGMNVPGEITQQRQTNVDTQIRSTPMDQKHPKGRNKNLQSDRISGGPYRDEYNADGRENHDCRG